MKKHNTKKLQDDRQNAGTFIPRVYVRKAKGKKAAVHTVKCGCCDEYVKIVMDESGIEINGVMASRSEWAKLLGFATIARVTPPPIVVIDEDDFLVDD